MTTEGFHFKHVLPDQHRGWRAGLLLTASLILILAVAFPLNLRISFVEALSEDGILEQSLLENLYLITTAAGVAVSLAMLAFVILWRQFKKSVSLLFASSSSSFLVIVIAFALLLRISWLIAIPTEPYTDFQIYHELAQNLVDGTGFMDDFSPPDYFDAGMRAFRPPGWPFLLAAAYRVFGVHIIVGKTLVLFFALAGIVLTYLLGRSIGDELVGRIAALIVAAFPSLVAYGSVLSTEIPFAALLLLASWILVRRDGLRFLDITLVGLSLGVATLIRPVAFLVPGVIFSYLWIRSKSFSHACSLATSVGVVVIIVILPWTIRNYQVLGSFVLVSSNSGVVLLDGSFTGGDGGRISHGTGMDMEEEKFTEKDRDRFNQLKEFGEVDRNRLATAWAIENIAADPMAYLSYGFRKLFQLYFYDTMPVSLATGSGSGEKLVRDEIRYGLMIVAESYYLCVLALFGLAIVVCPVRFLAGKAVLIFLLLGYWSCIHFIFTGSGRYHVPVTPILSIGAAIMVGVFATRCQSRKTPPSPMSDPTRLSVDDRVVQRPKPSSAGS